MKAKRVGAIALLLALVLSLVGCGKSMAVRAISIFWMPSMAGSWYVS